MDPTTNQPNDSLKVAFEASLVMIDYLRAEIATQRELLANSENTSKKYLAQINDLYVMMNKRQVNIKDLEA